MDLLLTVVDPTGDSRDLRVTVDPASSGAELIAALAGPGPPAGLRAVVERTGELIAPDRPVAQARLLVGDRLLLSAGADPPITSRPAAGRPAFEVRVVGGPGAGRCFPLAAGDALRLGRDPSCEIAVEDRRASRRHLHIAAGSRTVTVTDLGSTNGTFLDGNRVTGPRPVHRGQVIEVGATLLSVVPAEPAAGPAAISYQEGRLGFARPPRVQRPTPAPEVTLPVPPAPPSRRRIPLSAALIPVAMGGILAAVVGPVMLLFALMGPLMLAGTVWEDRRSGRRDYRAARRRFETEMADVEQRIAEQHADLVAARRQAAPDAASLAGRIRAHHPRLWERRPTDDDFATVRLGTADLPSRLRLAGDPGDLATAPAARIEAALARHAVDPAVPVDADLRTVGVLGVAGEAAEREALLRWLVLQSAALASPRDLAVVVLAPETAGWAWTRWLPHTEPLLAGIPHARSVAGQAEDVRAVAQVVDDLVSQRLAARDRGTGHSGPWRPQVLLVIPGPVPVPPPVLSRILADGPTLGVTAVVGAAAVELLPGECRAIVAAGPDGDGTTVTLTDSGDRIGGIVADGVALPLAEELARRLAPLRDSSAGTAAGELPPRVLLLDLLELPEPTGAAVAQRWAAAGRHGDLGAPVGVGAAGPVVLDLRRDGPHALAAGTTGAGKSELLQSLIGALAATYPADRLTFVLVDYKGGAAFKDCVPLPHTVGFFTDLDAHLAHRALVSLNAELRRREELLREHGAKDLPELERRNPPAACANLFIVFDEFAFLKKEVPQFVAGVIDIAQRGRSLGVHLMLATQRPTGVVDENIRANTNLRVALRMADEVDSNDVLERPDAARIPKALPGRGFVRMGHGEVTLFQSAYANARSSRGPQRVPTTVGPFRFASGLRQGAAGNRADEDGAHPTDLQRLVAAVREAHHTAGVADQPRPWLEPLRDHYDLTPLAAAEAPADATELAAAVGVVDLPGQQRQPPWWLDLGSAGHLLIYGTAGTGKTQLLRTLAVGLAGRLSPADLHVYGLDFAGRGLGPLTALPHCGGVATADEPERVDRLFGMLEQLVGQRQARLAGAGSASLVEHRAASGERLPYVLVLFDGYGAFHQSYLNVDRGELVDSLARLVASGPGVGVYFALTADRRGTVPATVASAVSARLVLRLADADEYASLGLPTAVAQVEFPPGRGFFDGDEVQVAVLGDDATGAGQAEAVATWAAALGEPGDGHHPHSRPPPVTVLTDHLTTSALPAAPATGAVVPVGRSGIHHHTSLVDLDSTPVFAVFGPDRSGRTTALATLHEGLSRSLPGLEAYLLSPRRGALPQRPGWTETATSVEACDTLAGLLGGMLRERLAATAATRWLVMIDDGDELADATAAGVLSQLVRRGRDAGAILVCAVQAHVAHRTFGGWITDLRKAKHGLLLTPDIEVDGELFGQRLPRRASRRFPPGRGFLVCRGEIDYLQVAVPDR